MYLLGELFPKKLIFFNPLDFKYPLYTHTRAHTNIYNIEYIYIKINLKKYLFGFLMSFLVLFSKFPIIKCLPNSPFQYSLKSEF